MTAMKERGPSLEAARQLIHAQRPELAERELRRWLAEHPEWVDGHALLGWCLAVQKRAKEALESAREAVRLAPDWPYAHASLAEVYLRLGRNRDAERSARTALEMGTFDTTCHALLSAALLNQPWRRMAAEALREADFGLALNPQHALCARLRALALSRLGRHEEARQAAAYARSVELQRQALRLDPGSAGARQGLRMAAYRTRLSAAMLVQSQRWKWPLLGIVAVIAAEWAAILAWRDGGLVALLAGCTIFTVGFWGGGMLWVRILHPRVVEELRLAGPDDLEAKEARQLIAFLLFFLLLGALAALLPS